MNEFIFERLEDEGSSLK